MTKEEPRERQPADSLRGKRDSGCEVGGAGGRLSPGYSSGVRNSAAAKRRAGLPGLQCSGEGGAETGEDGAGAGWSRGGGGGRGGSLGPPPGEGAAGGGSMR